MWECSDGWAVTMLDAKPSAYAATVCFLRRDGRVLLQERAPGRIWAGRLNGPGGKIADGESPEAAIVREVREETGLLVVNPVPAGTLNLLFGVPEESRLRVHIFVTGSFSGRARGGREGTLRWYAEDRLPFARLWPDMRYWLPAVLNGGEITGQCVYDVAGVGLASCALQVDLRSDQDDLSRSR